MILNKTYGGDVMKVLLTTLNAKYIHSSLALKYLKVVCQKVVPNTILKEYTINNHLLDIVGDIYSEEPDIIGFACYIWNIEMVLKIAQTIKKILPRTVIVLGGPEVSYEVDELIEENPFIDYVVMGEGEDTFAELLKQVLKGQEFSSLPGLAFGKGTQVIVGLPQVVKDINSIPFPYQDRDMDELKDKIIYYESSRGCPFSCQYCLSSATQGVRFLPLERVFEELQFFIKHDVRQVKFVDRTFNAKKEYYLPILKFLAKQSGRTNFHFEIAADLIDEEVLTFLKELPPGRVQFEIGVQSTHEPTLQKIQRKNDWKRIADNVKKIISYDNIHLHLDLIVGLPYETYERFKQSFNDVYSLQPHMLQIGFLKLLRGSGIRKTAIEHGYLFVEAAPYEVLENDYLTYREVRQLKILEDVFEQLYNSGRFSYVLPFLLEIHGQDPFSFYELLTQYWQSRQLHQVSHTIKSIYTYLIDFCERYYPEQRLRFLEVLKFNALVNEKGTLRPEFLPWNGEEWIAEKSDFWRDEQLVRRYLPEYTFTNWRDIKKQYHIEVFHGNVLAHSFVRGEEKVLTPVLFSFHNSSAKWQYVSQQDFLKKEC